MSRLRRSIQRLRLAVGTFAALSGVACAAQLRPEPPPALAEPSAALPARSDVTEGEPCGPLDCRKFATAADAFRYLLKTEPLVLGLGEAHALSSSEDVTSTARRFTDQLLPVLDGRASHLIVELLNPKPGCQKATESVREAHRPVTEPQSKSNQNDYVTLGQRAKALGIEPFVLSPSCEEYQAIANAGDDAILQTLQTIAQVTSRMLRAALVKNHSQGRERIVLAYGGALHNDLDPHTSRARFSYGPELAAFTRGRYMELDLIAREFIKDNEVWRALPWYEHYDPQLHGDGAIVMRWGPQSHVLFLPAAPVLAAEPTAP